MFSLAHDRALEGQTDIYISNSDGGLTVWGLIRDRELRFDPQTVVIVIKAG